MGYLIYAYTRKQVVKDLTRLDENEHRRIETLKHTLRGNVLWSVIKVTIIKPNESAIQNKLAAGDSYSFIGCHLIAKVNNSWGYKDMDESMYPYYYTCPLSYLDMVPEVCAEWRTRVRQYHQQLAEKRKSI